MVLKAPGPHQKRKDEPRTVPLKFLSTSGPTRIVLDCTYAHTAGPASCYLYAVVLVRPWSVHDILGAVKAGGTLSIHSSRTLCRAILEHSVTRARDEDVDVILDDQTHNTLSLRCPSTLMRIGIPARGLQCMHVQCFDLEFYVYSQTRTSSHKNRWKCPCCYRFCFPHELVIDTFVGDILANTTDNDKKVDLILTPREVAWRVKEEPPVPAAEEPKPQSIEAVEEPVAVTTAMMNVAPPPSRRPIAPLETSVIDLD